MPLTARRPQLPAPDRLYRIRVPRDPSPRAIIVAPPRYIRSKQLTVLRHDPSGVRFIDNYTERYDDWMKQEDRRYIRHIQCPMMHYQISLTACSSYCSGPCGEHLEAVKMYGWYTSHGKPIYKDKSSK